MFVEIHFNKDYFATYFLIRSFSEGCEIDGRKYIRNKFPDTSNVEGFILKYEDCVRKYKLKHARVSASDRTLFNDVMKSEQQHFSMAWIAHRTTRVYTDQESGYYAAGMHSNFVLHFPYPMTADKAYEFLNAVSTFFDFRGEVA